MFSREKLEQMELKDLSDLIHSFPVFRFDLEQKDELQKKFSDVVGSGWISRQEKDDLFREYLVSFVLALRL